MLLYLSKQIPYPRLGVTIGAWLLYYMDGMMAMARMVHSEYEISRIHPQSVRSSHTTETSYISRPVVMSARILERSHAKRFINDDDDNDLDEEERAWKKLCKKTSALISIGPEDYLLRRAMQAENKSQMASGGSDNNHAEQAGPQPPIVYLNLSLELQERHREYRK